MAPTWALPGLFQACSNRGETKWSPLWDFFWRCANFQQFLHYTNVYTRLDFQQIELVLRAQGVLLDFRYFTTVIG